MRGNLEDNLGLGDNFLDIASETQSMKERIDKLDSSEIKTYLWMVIFLLRQKATNGEVNIWKKPQDEGLVWQIHKELEFGNNKVKTLITK